MTIFRTEHNKNYCTINNSIAKDNRISYKAKGLWLYAFSRPDDWQFHLNDLIENSTDGRDSVKKGLSELEEFGYLQRIKNKDKSGKFRNVEWCFYEISIKSHSEELKKRVPQTDFPSVVFPSKEENAKSAENPHFGTKKFKKLVPRTGFPSPVFPSLAHNILSIDILKKQQEQHVVIPVPVEDVVVVFSKENKGKGTSDVVDPQKAYILGNFELTPQIQDEFLKKDLELLRNAYEVVKYNQTLKQIQNPTGMFIKAVRENWSMKSKESPMKNQVNLREKIKEDNKKIADQIRQSYENSFSSSFLISVSDNCVMCKHKEGFQIIEYCNPNLKLELMNYVKTYLNHQIPAHK